MEISHEWKEQSGLLGGDTFYPFILADCNNFICSCQKNFIWGVASRLCPPMILRMSFSKLSLIPIPCCSIFVCICCKRSSRPFTCNLVDLTVARNLSGPHACKEALDLAGVAEALLFFVQLSLLCWRQLHKVYKIPSNVCYQQGYHMQLIDKRMSLQNELLGL